jgi:chromate transporter
MGPAVVGILAVSLVRLAPHALPDAPAIVFFAGTVACLLVWRVAAIKLMIAGAVVGVLRSRLVSGSARGLGL